MPRKVLIRRKDLKSGYETDVYQLEAFVREQMMDILKEHREDLEDCADWIQSAAEAVVPYKTGALQDSINVRVSRSYRYPGMIASASAKDYSTYHHFDYARIQEENEDFHHNRKIVMKPMFKGGVPVAQEEGNERMAHYLGGPFASSIYDLLTNVYDVKVTFPPNLEHAKDYFESRFFGDD